MQVLEQVEARLAGALRAGQPLDQAEHLALARLRVHARHRPLGVGNGEEVEDQRQVVAEALVKQE